MTRVYAGKLGLVVILLTVVLIAFFLTGCDEQGTVKPSQSDTAPMLQGAGAQGQLHYWSQKTTTDQRTQAPRLGAGLQNNFTFEILTGETGAMVVLAVVALGMLVRGNLYRSALSSLATAMYGVGDEAAVKRARKEFKGKRSKAVGWLVNRLLKKEGVGL